MRSSMDTTLWLYKNKESGVEIRTYPIEKGEYCFATSKLSPLLNNSKVMTIAIYKDKSTAKTGHFGFIELETKINACAIRKEFSPVKTVTHNEVISKVPR